MLRRAHEPRRRRLRRTRVHRHVRCPPGRHRRGERREAVGRGYELRTPRVLLHHQRGAAGRRRQGLHRQLEFRVRRRDHRRPPRLPFRLRRRNRRPRVALLHRAGQPRRTLRTPRARTGGKDVEGRVVEDGRRRHRVELDRLRPRTPHGLYRHRQRRPVAPRHPLAGRRRQPVPVLHRGGRPRHRENEVVLPDDARRQLGLRGHPAHGARRNGDRRRAAQGPDAGAEERLLLRARP